MKVIQRDFLPDDLSPLLIENRIDGCVAVQADQSEEETLFLLALAERHPFIKGVVGWVDLKSADIQMRLSSFSEFPKLKGFRHVVQDENQGFLMQKDFLNGIKYLRNFNYTYDILVYSRQLEEVIWFINKFPDHTFVIDHIAKPSIKNKEFNSWAKNISMIASFKNVSCKLSGMVTEANWKSWNPSDFKSYLDFAFESFGVKRLLYGSDWPVCLVAATYNQQRSIIEDYINKLSVHEKELVMGGNAIRFYNL